MNNNTRPQEKDLNRNCAMRIKLSPVYIDRTRDLVFNGIDL